MIIIIFIQNMKSSNPKVGANYQYLFLKELKLQIKNHLPQIQQLIHQQSFTISFEQLLQNKTDLDEKRKVYSSLISKIRATKWGSSMLLRIKQRILLQCKQLYEFETQRNYFLVETFRESISEPTASPQSLQCVNLVPLYKVCINKELRRTVWIKGFFNEENKLEFFKYDHQISAYNLAEELSIGLIRVCSSHRIKIKQNQKDCSLRLLDYIIKKWNRLPNISEQYLSIGIVELFSHYTPNKIMELGSIFVGLVNISEVYFQPNLQERIRLIELGLSIVDPPTLDLIVNKYLPFGKGWGEVNECFEHFRLSMSFAYFPIGGSQFIVDQLLIKKKNKLDFYIIFGIMMMIMSDDFEKEKEEKKMFSDIVSAQKTKAVIKVEDVVDAFRVIYEKVPPFHQSVQEDLQGKNRILEELILMDREGREEVKGPNLNNLNEVDPGFVIVDNRQPLRLGNKKQ